MAIIPARSGSIRLKGKNWKMFGGRPLIEHTIEAALASKYLAEIIVSSDSPEVENIVCSFPTVQYHRRSPDLALKGTQMIDVVKEVLETRPQHPEFLILLQPTSPNRSESTIDESLDKLINSSGGNSIVSVNEIPHKFHPQKLGVAMGGILRRDNNEDYTLEAMNSLEPKYFYRNGAIYAFRVEEMMIQQTLLPQPVMWIETPSSESVDIDTLEDFILGEYHHKIRKGLDFDEFGKYEFL
jgi:CMP-N,N'-diacetyllegionaminic acid synthase